MGGCHYVEQLMNLYGNFAILKSMCHNHALRKLFTLKKNTKTPLRNLKFHCSKQFGNLSIIINWHRIPKL